MFNFFSPKKVFLHFLLSEKTNLLEIKTEKSVREANN